MTTTHSADPPTGPVAPGEERAPGSTHSGAAPGTVRFGILGCASIARRRTAPAMLLEPSADLVAVASRNPARAAELGREWGCAPAHGYQALLDRGDVDAVYVPLPTGLHAEWVERALLAGKHVLAEKPLTGSTAETERLLTLAADRGLVLMENLSALRNPVHRRVGELLEEGAVGELRAVEAVFAFPPPAPEDVRYDLALGGGALLDAGVYPVTTARTLLGDDVTVAGATLTRRAGGVDVAGSALLHDERGRTATLTFGFEHSYRCGYRLWGSHGELSLDRAYSPPATWESVIRIVREGEAREETLPPCDQFRASVREFVAAVARGVPSPTYPAVDVLAQARLIDRIRTVARVTERAGPRDTEEHR